MAEKLKGLTIELDLDTLKVNSGLTDLRSKLKRVNSEMRSNMSAFDYSERSVKKYETRIQGLNKKLTVQREVVESARKHYEKMVEVHGEGSKEADKAAIAYNHQATELNNLERHIRKTTTELKEFERQQAIQSTTLHKAGEGLINFGNKLDNISTKVKGVGQDLTKYLTLPITGLVTLFGASGFKRAMSLEQVEFMMDHISDSAEEYEKRMETVMDLVTDTRFGTAEIGNEFAKLLGAGASDESAKIFNEVAMNLATFKSDDSLIPRFGDMFTSALQAGAIDGTMINQFASAGVDVLKTLGNVWGKSTEDVRKILRDGDKDIQTVLNDLSIGILEGTKGVNGATKAMGGMLEGSGQLLSGQIKNFYAAISQTGERLIKETGLFDSVKDSLSELRNMLKSGELDSVLLPTFQGIQKALEALVDITRKLFKWFSSLSDETKQWIGNLVGLSVVLGPILTGLGIFGGIVAKISTGIGKLFQALAPLAVKLSKFGGTASKAGGSVSLLSRALTFFTGPVGIAVGIISALAGVLVLTYKKSEAFKDSVKKLGTSIKDVFSGLWTHIKPGVDAVASFFSGLKEQFLSFKDGESSQIVEALTNIVNGLTFAFEGLGKVIDFVMPYIALVVQSAWKSIQGTIEYFSSLIIGSMKIFSGLFTGDWAKMWEGVTDILEGFVSFLNKSLLGQALDVIKKYFSNLNKETVDAFSVAKDYLIEKTAEISKAIVDWAKDFGEKFAKSFREKKDQIVDALSEWGKSIKGKTVELSKDIYEWFKELPGKAKKAFIDKKNEITSAFNEWKDAIQKKTIEIKNDLIKWAKELPGKIKDSLSKGANVFEEWLKEQHELNKEFYFGLGKDIKKWLNSTKDDVADGFSSWGENIDKFFKELPDKIKEQAKKSWDNFKNNLLEKSDSVKKSFDKWKEKITKFFDELPDKVKEKAEESWNNFKDNLLDKAESIKDGFNKWKDEIAIFFEELPGNVKEKAKETFDNFKENLLNKVDEIKEGFEAWKKGISDWFDESKESMKEGASKFGEGFVNGITELKDNIVNGFETWKENIINWFQNLGKSDEIKETGTEIVKSVKKGVEEGAESEKQSFIDNIGAYIVDGIKYALIAIGIILLAVGREIISRIAEGMESAKTNVTNVVLDLWTNIKRVFSEKANEVYTSFKSSFIGQLISSIIGFAKDFEWNITDMWNAAVRTFEKGKENILKPIELAKEKISEIVEDIKGFFDNLKLKIPKPEMPTMPKFSLKTSTKTIFGKEVTFPSGLGVNWNAKGGIFTKPTIFNTDNAGLQGVGEAGAEAILPLSRTVLSQIGEAIARYTPVQTDASKLIALVAKQIDKPTKPTGDDQNNEMLTLIADQNEYLQKMVELLMFLLEKDTDINIDGVTVVKLLGPEMSKFLAKMNKESARKKGVL